MVVTKADSISHWLVHEALDAEDTRQQPPHQPTTNATLLPDDNPGLAKLEQTPTPSPSPPNRRTFQAHLLPCALPLLSLQMTHSLPIPPAQVCSIPNVPTRFQTTETCSPYLRLTSTNWSPASKRQGQPLIHGQPLHGRWTTPTTIRGCCFTCYPTLPADHLP